MTRKTGEIIKRVEKALLASYNRDERDWNKWKEANRQKPNILGHTWLARCESAIGPTNPSAPVGVHTQATATRTGSLHRRALCGNLQARI